MTHYQEKFQKLLRELFQFDSADLDFGIYAILNQRREQIAAFIDQRLPEILQAGLELEAAEQRAAAQEKLAEARQRVLEAVDPEALDEHGNLNMAFEWAVNSAVYKEYKATKDEIEKSSLAEDTEAQIYNDLYRFFSRYYDDGDFVTKRRFGQDKYALPYNGQEVYLHWANADQYYIKSGEHFTDYSFTLPATTSDQTARVVFFKLQQAEVDRDNTKSDDKRFFVLHPEDPFTWDEEARTLTLNFEYRALTPAEKERVGSRNQQDKLNDEALDTLTVHLPTPFLKEQMLQPDGDDDAKRPRFIRHLNRYTARNTRDFFIHKNLAAFLRQELDYFLKNEVLNIDDIDLDNPQRARLALARVQVIRQVGHHIIAFLAQIENFQKRLFEKRKFIRQSDYCLTLDRIPASVRDDVVHAILASPAQLQAWRDLYALAEADFDKAFLTAHPHLMLDTAFLPADMKARLLGAFDDLDEVTDGLLVHGENYQTLNLLLTQYIEQVKCIYIDPPYNTGNDNFIYKDSFQHSSWLAMMENRLELAKEILVKDGVVFTSIDENELANLENLFSVLMGLENKVATFVWEAGRKNDSRLVSVSHEYMLCVAKDKQSLIDQKIIWRNRKEGIDEIYKKVASLIREHKKNYHLISEQLREWLSGLPDNHPAKRHKHYNAVDERGVYFPSDVSWPGGGGPTYEVLHPITGRPCKIPKRGWMYPTSERMQEAIANNLVHFWEDETKVPCAKAYLKDNEGQAPNSVFYQDGRAATKRLRHIMGGDFFRNPKDETIIQKQIEIVTNSDEIVLDFFAGSGTTGHAVMNLNKADNGHRKYILVEMGDYFDTVLKPRLMKVAYAADWKNGKPVPGSAGQSQMFHYIRLESYEDALTSIGFKDRQAAPDLFSQLDAMPDYQLHYMLDFETEGSATLLNLEQFNRPFEYHLKDGPVDLVTTFNFLLGLRVETQRTHIWETGPVVCVTGVNRDEQRVGVIWRNAPGSPEQLEAERTWLEENVLAGLTLDTLYINGDSVLPHAQPLEPEFKRLMFASVTPAPVLEVE